MTKLTATIWAGLRRLGGFFVWLVPWLFWDGLLKRICASAGLLVVVAGLTLLVTWWQWDRISDWIEPRTRKQIAVRKIAGTENPNRRGDVVFIHGLGASAITNWQDAEHPEFLWPKCLHEDANDLGIWSLDYDAYPSEWLGGTMPLEQRSENLLEQMRLNGLGNKPIIFVGHSLGGIVAKKMIWDAHTGNLPEYDPIARQIKGVVFLATPHAGSDQATLLNLGRHFGVRPSDTTRELRSNESKLLDLKRDYANNVAKWRIANRVLYETRGVPPVGIIVENASADPGIPGAIITPVDEDHLSICRFATKDHIVYKSVSEFIATYLKPMPKPSKTTYAQLIERFAAARGDGAQLELFKKSFERQEFTWQVIVKAVIPATSSPTSRPGYYVQPTKDTPKSWECVLLRFSDPTDGFDLATLQGTVLDITGVFDPDATAISGIVLSDARVIRIVAGPD